MDGNWTHFSWIRGGGRLLCPEAACELFCISPEALIACPLLPLFILIAAKHADMLTEGSF